MILKVLFILLLYTTIGFFEIIPLKKEKNKKKLILYLVLLSFSTVVSILITLGVKIPSPSIPIKQFVTFIFKG
ncbi:MAG: hypothetical protein K0R09_1496 [Clostridiales bacterium]|jgi:hypothetical protein|nr:hypothetical protein [Clostridiales bacterium]